MLLSKLQFQKRDITKPTFCYFHGRRIFINTISSLKPEGKKAFYTTCLKITREDTENLSHLVPKF